MGIELFGFCHEFDGTANLLDAFLRQVLEGDLTAVRVEVYAVVGCGVAVSGQRMVGAAGVVASTLTGILTEEDTTCIDNLVGQLFVVFRLDDQVLWGIAVAELHHLVVCLDKYQSAVLQRFGCYFLAWQLLQLSFHLLLNFCEFRFGCGDEQHLRVDAVLGL